MKRSFIYMLVILIYLHLADVFIQSDLQMRTNYFIIYNN